MKVVIIFLVYSKKGRQASILRGASDLFLSFFSIVVCKYMEEISIGSLFPMVVISFFFLLFFAASRYVTVFENIPTRVHNNITWFTVMSNGRIRTGISTTLPNRDKDRRLSRCHETHQKEKWNSILQRSRLSQYPKLLPSSFQMG